MLYGFISSRYNKLIGILLVLLFLFPDSSSSQQLDNQKILIMGDSLIQGFGLAQKDGFVNQLERHLIDQGMNIQLVNGGVSGDTTAGGLARLEWSLTDDIGGVMISLGANDMLRGLPPGNAKKNLAQIVQKLKERGLPVLLVGIKSIANYGSKYKLEFDQIFEDLSNEYDLILYPDLLAPIIEQKSEKLEDYLQADKLHPNADGVLLIVNGVVPFVIELIELTKFKH